MSGTVGTNRREIHGRPPCGCRVEIGSGAVLHRIGCGSRIPYWTPPAAPVVQYDGGSFLTPEERRDLGF